MKKYFLTGLVILLPMVITVMILMYLVELFTAPLIHLVNDALTALPWKMENYRGLVVFLARILTLVIIAAFTTLIGFLAQKFFIHRMVMLANLILSKTPIVKPIYLTIKQLTKMIFSQEKKFFEKTVLIPFPNANSRALGFLTSKSPDFITKKVPLATKVIFMPTAPHPLSGLLFFCQDKDVEELNITTEDAMKFIISCGVIHPENPNEPS